MKPPGELPENWRDEWRQEAQDRRRESWRDVTREALRFGWWYESRIAIPGMALLVLAFIVAIVVAAIGA